MLNSMTGFGRGEFLDTEHRFAVEIKAVNHRYNEIVIRAPKILSSLEDKVRRQISGSLSRGRIDVFVTIEEYSAKKRAVRVDKELAMAYHNALGELGNLFQVPVSDTVQLVQFLAKYPDVIHVDDAADDAALLWPKLSKAIEGALANLMDMRRTEGESMTRDLVGRIDILAGLVGEIEDRAPQILADYRERLLSRIRELLNTVGVEPDESRLLQETALFADRTNFTEELVRLKSHFSQFRKALDSGVAVGRKLDFIVQEFNRETNTIASKANDLTVANIVVEIKSEIEKVREQIQNIE